MNDYDKIIDKIEEDFKKNFLVKTELNCNNALLKLKYYFGELFQSFKSLMIPYLLLTEDTTSKENNENLTKNLNNFRNDFINVVKGMSSLYKIATKKVIYKDFGFSDFIDENSKNLLEMYNRIITGIPESETKKKLTNAYFAFDIIIRAINTEIMLYNYQNENKLKTLKIIKDPKFYDFENFDLKIFLDDVVKRINDLLDFKELKP